MPTTMPAQRCATHCPHHISVLAELVVDHVLSGVAGTDAARHIDTYPVSTDPAVLLADLAASDLSESARFGLILRAFVDSATTALAGA